MRGVGACSAHCLPACLGFVVCGARCAMCGARSSVQKCAAARSAVPGVRCPLPGVQYSVQTDSAFREYKQRVYTESNYAKKAPKDLARR